MNDKSEMHRHYEALLGHIANEGRSEHHEEITPGMGLCIFYTMAASCSSSLRFYGTRGQLHIKLLGSLQSVVLGHQFRVSASDVDGVSD